MHIFLKLLLANSTIKKSYAQLFYFCFIEKTKIYFHCTILLFCPAIYLKIEYNKKLFFDIKEIIE